VNKGFEVIETHYFFSLAYESISVIVHRESAVHALLQQRDKSLIACIYPADMRIPIAFALYYPQRQGFYEGVNFAKSFSLSFEPLQQSNFPLFELIIAAAKRKDNCLAILNACDEVAIDYFLKGKIKFTDIHKVMQYLFERYKHFKLNTVEDIFYWDNWARRRTHSYLEGLC
jgi:1-deoxy-D-xylulose-5-phosphate reductoisomerase